MINNNKTRHAVNYINMNDLERNAGRHVSNHALSALFNDEITACAELAKTRFCAGQRGMATLNRDLRVISRLVGSILGRSVKCSQRNCNKKIEEVFFQMSSSTVTKHHLVT